VLTLEEYERLNPVCEVPHESGAVRYLTPSSHLKWRVDSLFEKEPCTIEWIAGFAPGEVLVDIGANVGMYTIWAAKTRGAVRTTISRSSAACAPWNTCPTRCLLS
jgi:hypothetical protein